MGSRVVAYQTGARPSPGDYRGGPFRMVGERGP
jgi:hypothetical protein